jgi:hypothetical protein
VLAFLLTGPATSLTALGAVSRSHGRRAALGLGGLVLVLASGLGHLANHVPGLAATVPGYMAPLAADWHAWALALLAVLFLVSLVRRGPRAFLGELFEADGEPGPHEPGSHTHGHGERCACSSSGAEAGGRPAPAMVVR